LFDGLRVSFEVTKTLGGEPNKSTMSIYGLDTQTYQMLLAKERELVVQLFAGHEIPGLIFQGNPVKAGLAYKIEPPERVLTVEAKDGYRSYQRGRMKKSFAGEVTMTQVLEEAAASLGIPLDTVDIPGDIRFTQGVHLRGPAHRVLDRLAQSTGSDWSIQNGKLQFLPKSKVRRDSGPLYATELNNIISHPTKKEKGIELTVILDPSIAPGDRFEVRDDDYPLFNGVYKASAIRHTGDNWDTAFFTEIEAAEVVDPKPAKTAEFIGTLFTDQYEALVAAARESQVNMRNAHDFFWNEDK
jgi:hypothetical protein